MPHSNPHNCWTAGGLVLEKKKIIEALKKARDGSKKRNFTQSIDFIMNLRSVDIKAAKLSDSVQMPSGRGKPVKIVAIVDGEGVGQAKSAGADLVISRKQISDYDKRKAKKLANDFDWFVVQAHLMQPFASAFGAALGARGKMPFPKDIVPPNKNPEPTIKRLKNSIRLRVKNKPVIHTAVGTESMSDEELAENVLKVYDNVLHKLEKGIHSVGDLYVKTTMGTAVRV